MGVRVCYRRNVSYNTRSNKVRKVKTPGGRLSVLHLKKSVKAQVCSEPGCGIRLGGLKRVRSSKLKHLKQRERTISRPYGGNLCAQCVKNRIIRAFLVEEVKIVKKVMNTKKN